MNIDKAPGLFTYLGGVITLIGISSVIYGGRQLEKRKTQGKSKQIKERLIETSFTK
jgi:hypothetical protein